MYNVTFCVGLCGGTIYSPFTPLSTHYPNWEKEGLTYALLLITTSTGFYRFLGSHKKLPYRSKYRTTPLFKTNLQKKTLITKIDFV